MRRLLPLFLLALAGCANTSASPTDGPAVVASTSHAADLATRVLCRAPQSADEVCRTEARPLLDARADPHDYELRPDDVAVLSEAGVIVRSGGEIDEWLDEAIDAAGTQAPVVDLLEAAGGEDPHWWTDPAAAERAVEAIRAALSKRDPDNADLYADNARAYTSDLRALDAAIRRCVDRVPAARRKVVTTHDALGRFADRYGIEVVGTVIPSRSTAGQASSRQVAELVRDIRTAGATVVFSEASVSRGVERAIAEEAGARLGKPLRLDSLGEESYLSATAKNAAALVEGMSGGKVQCSLPS